MEDTISEFCDSRTEQFYDRELGAYLQYKIVCTPDPVISDSLLDKVYSLLMIKFEAIDSVETKFFYDITRNREKAGKILNALHSHAVTPCTADELLQEMV